MFSDQQCPVVGIEEHPWVSSIPREMLSQSARRAHTGPYRAALVPAIARAALVLPSEVAGLVADASGEIARFDAEVGAQLAPFAGILLRSESASSSLIEHLSSGAKAIAVAELGDTSKRNATEIVGNVAAMRAAIEPADHPGRRRDPRHAPGSAGERRAGDLGQVAGAAGLGRGVLNRSAPG
jgi:hypothetical protein